MKATAHKRFKKQIRHQRVRSRVEGTSLRPRLSIFRSLAHIHAQLIDDVAGKTLAAASTMELKKSGTKTESAALVGTRIAEKAKELKITEIVFDRGGNKYHGRVKAVADAAREAGLNF